MNVQQRNLLSYQGHRAPLRLARAHRRTILLLPPERPPRRPSPQTIPTPYHRINRRRRVDPVRPDGSHQRRDSQHHRPEALNISPPRPRSPSPPHDFNKPQPTQSQTTAPDRPEPKAAQRNPPTPATPAPKKRKNAAQARKRRVERGKTTKPRRGRKKRSLTKKTTEGARKTSATVPPCILRRIFISRMADLGAALGSQ